MTCQTCRKRWFCLAACPQINFELVRTYEQLTAARKIFTLSWEAT